MLPLLKGLWLSPFKKVRMVAAGAERREYVDEGSRIPFMADPPGTPTAGSAACWSAALVDGVAVANSGTERGGVTLEERAVPAALQWGEAHAKASLALGRQPEVRRLEPAQEQRAPEVRSGAPARSAAAAAGGSLDPLDETRRVVVEGRVDKVE